jgi:hypothetical protein
LRLRHKKDKVELRSHLKMKSNNNILLLREIGRRPGHAAIPKQGASELKLSEIVVDCLVHVCPPGHCQRMLLPRFVENLRDRLLAQKIIGDDELNDLLMELKRRIDDPQPLVLVVPFFQAWGRRPE